MADAPRSDLVMMFVTKEDEPVYGECVLEAAPGDPFMENFVSATEYTCYSNFFEVQSFTFEHDIKDEDESRGGGDQRAAQHRSNRSTQLVGVAGDFASWRSATDEEARDMVFQRDAKKFKFTRLIDAASPLFFWHCANAVSFSKAALVKRVSRGGTKKAEGFLRIDFTNVLLRSLNWTDGDMTTEECMFECRRFKIRYRQQRADGGFGAQSSVEWDNTEQPKRRH